MRSVADTPRADDRRALAALIADERVALARRLGERARETFRLAPDPPPTPAEADRHLRRQRQRGRRLSACLRELIG